MAAGEFFSAGQSAGRAFPAVTEVLLDVRVAAMGGFGAELRAGRVERAAIVLAEDRHGSGAALAGDRNGEKTRRTFARMAGQLARVSPTRERFIADLLERRSAALRPACRERDGRRSSGGCSGGFRRI